MELRRNDRLITKKYKEYFIPTILMTMSSSMAIIVDGIIVGNLLGANALAAVNVSYDTYYQHSITCESACESIIFL